jgi:hypothetical protein
VLSWFKENNTPDGPMTVNNDFASEFNREGCKARVNVLHTLNDLMMPLEHWPESIQPCESPSLVLDN